jgi:gliding motility-associated-like protein
MKTITKTILIFLFSLVAVFGNAQCPTNIGFEQTASGTYNGAGSAYAVNGWTLSGNYANSNSANYNCANLGTPYNLGANEFAIVSTPLTYNSNGGGCSFILGASPFGGTQIARLNNNTSNYARNKIATTFNVTAMNTLFQFAFAGYYENPGHNCCDQPGLYLRVLNACSGNTVASCSSMSLAANCGTVANVSFTTCGTLGVMSNWQVKVIDLTPYIGGCVTIEAWTADCNFGGHYGTTFFDAMCGGQLIGQGLGGIPGGPIPGPVSYCSGSGVATIAAPSGYSSYQWYGPNGIIPAPQGTLSVLTVTNPIPGQTYTVQLISQGGCQLNAINTLNTSTISIAGIGSSTTCLNGSSGSATVQGNGSGAGYTYTWTNSSNSVVGTSSVAINLPAGIYSVTIAGLGNSMCGSASATIAVASGTPVPQKILKPYCGGQAFLTTGGGTNFQWFVGNTPITGSLGVAPNYTVNSPSNGAVYNLTYTSIHNCNEVISYTLMTSPPGAISVSSSSVCPNGSNGTGTINLTPASGSPPNINYFIVTSNTLAYSSSLITTPLTTYTFNNLSAGTYSINVFDGSCSYSTTLNVPTHLFTWTLSPGNTTLCQGQQIAGGVNFGNFVSPNQYQYNWSPTTMLFGSTFQTNIISASVAPGTSTLITYSVTVTPSIINCPQTKTMSLLVTNPITPTFAAIPNLCNNGTNFTIQATPNGGTFSIPNGVIVPTSTALAIGTNTFNYSYTQNNCSASNSSTFQLNQYNPSNLTSTISPICVTGNIVNLMNIVQNTVGVWSGTNVVNNTFNPAFLPTNNYVFTYSTQSNPNPTVCPSFSNLTISVTNTISPSIIFNPEFCTNASSFQLVANPNGGIWTNPAVTQNGVVTPSLATLQNTLTNYIVNVGPCVNTNTFALKPSIFRSAALTGSIAHQCVTSPPVNLMSIVQNTLGVWTGPNVNGFSFNPTGLSTNTYILTYSTQSTPNTTLCPDSRTIAVSVLNPPTPNIVGTGPFCSKDAAVQLTVSPNIGTWVTTSFLNSNGIFNPQTAGIGNNLVQYIIGTSTCNSQQTKTISVESFVPSTIIQIIPDQCNTSNAINLNPYTSNQGVWSGPGISGNLFVPSSSGTGSIILTHSTATSPSGLCPNNSTIAVRVYSLQSPIITTVTQICNLGNPFQLQVVPIGGIFSGVNSNAISYSGLYNPALSVIGDNLINYSITAGPCVAIAQTTINVIQFKSANLAATPKEYYCIGEDQPFNLNSFVQNIGGVWSGPGLIGSMFHPTLANVGDNVLTYQIQNWLCPDTKTVNIKTAKIIQPTLTVNESSGCEPFQIVLNSNMNSGFGIWKFGDGSPDVKDLYTSHTYTSPGIYDVNYSYISEEGCTSPTKSITSIKVFENPKADFISPLSSSIENPEIQTINKTYNLPNYTYTWTVSNGISVNSVNLNFIPTKVGQYEIKLFAKSIHGCTSSISKFVDVRNEFQVYIPNAFTPDDDGLNDVFIPVFSPYGIEEGGYQFQIFDRWGHPLFYTTDIHKGWNGKFKGEPIKEGSYVWILKFYDSNKVVYNKIGHVILLR